MTYLNHFISNLRLRPFLLIFWSLLTLVTGLITLIDSLELGVAVFLSQGPFNLLIFLVFCGSLLKLAVSLVSGNHNKAINWVLLIAELCSLNPIAAGALLFINKQAVAKKMTLEERFSVFLLGVLSLVQIMLYVSLV